MTTAKLHKATRMRRCGIYVRISQDRSGQGLGVERQEKACRKHAIARGWDIAAVYIDNDVSASSGKKRPEYQRMLRDLRDNVINAVCVWDLDRLTRRPIEIEEFISLADKHDVALASVGGDFDLSTDNGRMYARIKGAVARAEVERKSERTTAADLQAAEAGKPRATVRCFGFEADNIRHNKREAKQLLWATNAVIAGDSLIEVARTLTDRGFSSTLGRPFDGITLRQLLMRPRNAGLSSYRREVVGKGIWEPIVPEETWRTLVTMLSEPGRRTATDNHPRWLLSGVALCGAPGCDETLRIGSVKTRQPGVKRRVYRCRTGTHLARDSTALDDFVARLVIARLARPDAIDLVKPEERVDLKVLHAETRMLRKRLEQFAVQAADGEITGAQLRVATKRVQDKLGELERDIALASRTDTLAPLAGREDAAQRWKALSLSRQRDIVRTLMTVTVLPTGRTGAGFRPEGVDVVWTVAE
jgi:site-specific DNA recombinase